MTSRRTFLKNTTLAIAGATLVSNPLLATEKKKRLVGLQLYSVREDMGKDPLGTLQAIAKIGYKNVEHASYRERKFYGWSAKEFKKILGDLDLKMPSGHTVMFNRHWDSTANDFTDEWKYTVEDAAILGQKYVISPSLENSARKNYSDLLRMMERFNKSGELCKKYGMKFGYHNHAFEFSEKLNDKVVYDIIMDNTEPSLVIHQLDIGNMYNANAKAADVIKRYPGRFMSLHVKDEIKTKEANAHEPYESTVLGTGVINVKEVLDLAKNVAGTEHFIVEQESYQGEKPLDAMTKNLVIMKRWGF